MFHMLPSANQHNVCEILEISYYHLIEYKMSSKFNYYIMESTSIWEMVLLQFSSLTDVLGILSDQLLYFFDTLVSLSMSQE